MDSKRGFGIVMVMIGAVMLGIFALVFTQRMQNRANVSLIADLMAFREQVLTYYGGLVANRASWECTHANNESLKIFIATGERVTSGTSHAPIPNFDAVVPDGNLAVYDGDGNCQEKFGGGGGGTLRIPNSGLGLSLTGAADYLPAPDITCNRDVHHFCLIAEWEAIEGPDLKPRFVDPYKVGATTARPSSACPTTCPAGCLSFMACIPDYCNVPPGIPSNPRCVCDVCVKPRLPEWKRGVEVTLRIETNRKVIKNDLDVSFELANKEHSLYINRTAATDCSDGRVTGFFPGRATGSARVWDGSGYLGSTAPGPVGTGVNAYMGDAAVVNFDTVTGLVQCHGRPLVIPPCYDMSDYSYIDDYGVARTRPKDMVNPFVSGTGAPGYRGFQSDHGFSGIYSSYHIACDGTANSAHGVDRSSRARQGIKGKCPETPGSGTTAIAFFDPHTGISHCSNPNILVEKTADQVSPEQLCDGDNWFGIVKIRSTGSNSISPSSPIVGTFQCSTDHPGTRGKVGVQPYYGGYPCAADEAITGFDGEGKVLPTCRTKSAGTPGFPGPKGEKGDDGAWLFANRPQTTVIVDGVSWPNGPGVGLQGSTGHQGQNQSCSCP